MILLFCVALGNAQDPSHWRITDEDGLPSQTTYQVVQDSIGFIWIGTSNGLVRFDGKEFKSFKHPKQSDNEIVTVMNDNYGRIWYTNLSNQLFYIERDSISYFWGNDIRKPHRLNSYLVANDQIILHTDDNLNNDTTYITSLPINKPIQNLKYPNLNFHPAFKSSKPLLWDRNTDFIFNVGPGLSTMSFVPTSPNDSLTYSWWTYLKNTETEWGPNAAKTSKIKHYIFDNKFYLSKDNYLHIYDLATQKKSILSFKENISTIHSISGNIFILTNGGFSMLSKGQINKDFQTQLEDYSFNDIFLDREGNFWLATVSSGIVVIPSLNIQNHKLSDKKAPVYSLRADIDKNRIFVGQEKGTISLINLFSRNIEENYSIPFPVGRVVDFLIDEYLIICTDKNLIYQKPNNRQEYKLINNSGAVKSISKDSHGNYLLGASGGAFKIPISKLDSPSDFFLGPSQRMIFKRTYSNLEDFDGKIWIGTTTGIYINESKKTIPFLENDNHVEYSVSDIIQSRDSTIWVATNESGLLKIKNDKIIDRYNTENQLTSNTCRTLFESPQGNLWIGTSNGLFVLNPNTNVIRNFNKYDGLPSNDILSLAVTDSTVWVGTSKGLVSIPVNENCINNIPPPIILTKFSVHEQDTLITDKIKLPYNQNSVQIDFLGLGFKSKGNITYQYQMLGIDSTWVNTTTRYARFPALQPNDYTFNVVAVNEDGRKSEIPATIKITIIPAWWQTWTFRISAILILLGSGWIFLYLRFKRQRKQEKEKNDLDKKVHELSLMALQTQMNPHFIFNSLNAIQEFFTTNDQEKAMRFLGKFAKLIRLVFDQSRQKYISLDEELDFLNIYLSLESLRFNDEVKIDVEISREVDQDRDIYRIPPLLIQPIVENSFKHGLFHKSKNKELSIKFEQYQDHLKCTIQDNGVGRKRAGEINEWKKKNHRSAGLKTTKERLNLLHKDIKQNINSVEFFSITDLFDENQNPTGTRVEILI